MRRFKIALAACSAAASLAVCGCAAAVDKNEVQQKANPVGQMHKELVSGKGKEKVAPAWTGYEDALAKARGEGKFVMIDFYTGWCKWCRKLDTDTYSDPAVVKALSEGFVAVKIDAESEKKVVHEMRQVSMSELAQVYGVRGYPAIWFLEGDGGKAKLLEGYLPADAFLKYLEYIKSGKYKDMEFEDYLAREGKS